MDGKEEKFVRLAEARVTKAIKDIRLIGNLSNKNTYAYADDDVRKMFRALQKELDAAKSRFGNEGGKSDEIFKLRE